MISLANGNKPDIQYSIVQADNETYIASVNDFIDTLVLSHYLEKHLALVGMELGYEYAIYECSSEHYVFKRSVGLEGQSMSLEGEAFEDEVDYLYFFVLRFPEKSSFLYSRLGPWNLIVLLVVFVLFFFVYAVWIVLRQRRYSEIQKDFINNMPHEFKPPISTISVSSAALKSGPMEEDKATTYAQIIWDEAQRLNRQVEKVLDVAKSEKNHFELKMAETNIHEIIEGAVKKVSTAHSNEEMRIRCKLELDVPSIKLDPVHFGNVAYNLLDNGIKYSPENIDIEIRSSLHSSGMALIEFEDHGLGMSKQEAEKVFRKFYRVNTGNVHNVKGFGLGLYYVQQIAKAHKWKWKLDTELGKGSVFKLLMPLKWTKQNKYDCCMPRTTKPRAS